MNIIFQIILGILIADFCAGFLHWFEDNYLDYCINIPILSDIAIDNELHHYFPRGMLAYSNLEHSVYTILGSLGLLIFLLITNIKLFNKYPYFLFSLLFFLSTSNIIHSISHKRDCENNKAILFLQNCGILCSHKHHSMHHNYPHTKYCVILPINNYILDTILFWRLLEYIIYLTTNKKASQKRGYNDYSSIHNHLHENAKLECPDKPTKEDIKYLLKKLKEYKKCK